MSNPYLPPEILDYVVDILYDKPETLRNCCLVSKSWVPRTRKHIFAKVKLRSEEDLESWMKTFPDPSNSPAYHTHTLVFRGTTTDPRAVGSIQKFSRVTRLRLAIPESLEESDSLALFHKLSHTLKSPCGFSLPVMHADSQLRLFVPPSRRSNLVRHWSVIG